jgi:phytoene dehydrogenase-like protein
MVKPKSCAWLYLLLFLGEASGFVLPPHSALATARATAPSPTELYLIRRILRRLRNKEDPTAPITSKDTDESLPATRVLKPESQTPVLDETSVLDELDSTEESIPSTSASSWRNEKPTEEADIVIIGAGVSGLTAAIQAAKKAPNAKIVVLEGSPTIGGRVQSDVTDAGFVLDRGFAVFIEEYPTAKQVLDYSALELAPFLPGALIKLPNRASLARVADPLRIPADLFTAILAPVGSLLDKIKVLPLIYHVRTSSIQALFEEEETTTKTALTDRWGFSDDFLESFFEPFLEGIYLAPLAEQSSRMFSFVFKMFSEGAATLPKGGMGAVVQQLGDKAAAAGVEVRTEQPVQSVKAIPGDDEEATISYLVKTSDGNSQIQAQSVVVATDGVIAQELISQLEGFESLQDIPSVPQRSVGSLYYSFKGEAPVQDPILILNGISGERGTTSHPINNICFPSVVSPSYAPIGYSLCSVTVLTPAMEAFQGDDEGLDQAVRQQLASWFSDQGDAILGDWKLEGIYRIPKAQPGQLKGPFPANENGGRPCTSFRGKPLPSNIFVCGDHMATATLNGALESGVNAGQAASVATSKSPKPVIQTLQTPIPN